MNQASVEIPQIAGLRQSLSDLNFEIECAEDHIPGGPSHAQRLDRLYRDRRELFRSLHIATGV